MGLEKATALIASVAIAAILVYTFVIAFSELGILTVIGFLFYVGLSVLRGEVVTDHMSIVSIGVASIISYAAWNSVLPIVIESFLAGQWLSAVIVSSILIALVMKAREIRQS